ncbi:MAG: hypothetical protein NVSMB1_06380 [Polyangiales bacterium]
MKAARWLAWFAAISCVGTACIDTSGLTGGQRACDVCADAGSGGTCTPASCAGSCVNIESDPNHCGGCGTACRVGEICRGHVCSCPESHTCGATCIDIESDPANCGSCGRSCVAINCTSSCSKGTCVPTLVADKQTEPRDVALFGDNVYWAQRGMYAGSTGVIRAAPKAGGPVVDLARDRAAPNALTVDGTNLFWSQRVANLPYSSSVYQLSLAAGATPVLIGKDFKDMKPANALTSDATSVYLSNEARITRATIGAAGVAVIELAKATAPTGVVVDATSTYFSASDAVYKVPLSGGTPAALPNTTTANPQRLVISKDKSTLYFIGVDAAGGGNGKIYSYALSSGALVTLADKQNKPSDLAVDDTFVYWLNGGDFTLAKAPLAGGTTAPIMLAVSPVPPTKMAVDSSCVFWSYAAPNGASQDAGAVLKVAK